MAEFPRPFGSVTYKRQTEPEKHRFVFTSNGVTHRLKINRQTDDLAVLQYVDANAAIQPFPPGFTVSDANNNPALYLGNNFVLVWLNSYLVRFNGTAILDLRNQKHQSIFGGAVVQRGHSLQMGAQPDAQVVLAEDAVVE